MENSCNRCLYEKDSLNCKKGCGIKNCRYFYDLIEYGAKFGVVDCIGYQYYKYKNLVMLLNIFSEDRWSTKNVYIYVIDDDFLKDNFTSIYSYKGKKLEVYGETKINKFDWLLQGKWQNQFKEMEEIILNKKKELEGLENIKIKITQIEESQKLKNNIDYFDSIL